VIIGITAMRSGGFTPGNDPDAYDPGADDLQACDGNERVPGGVRELTGVKPSPADPSAEAGIGEASLERRRRRGAAFLFAAAGECPKRRPTDAEIGWISPGPTPTDLSSLSSSGGVTMS
jgi:hypothetical protein